MLWWAITSTNGFEGSGPDSAVSTVGNSTSLASTGPNFVTNSISFSVLSAFAKRRYGARIRSALGLLGFSSRLAIRSGTASPANSYCSGSKFESLPETSNSSPIRLTLISRAHGGRMNGRAPIRELCTILLTLCLSAPTLPITCASDCGSIGE